MIYRRPLSKEIVSVLSLTEHVAAVGLAMMPPNAGWDGQPSKDATRFRPYSVVNAGASGGYTGPISGNLQDWQLPYMVSTFGISPEQTEFIADEIRFQFVTMKNLHLTLGVSNYKVQQVKIESIGSIQRVDATDPAYFGQTDSYTVWLSKELA